MIYFLEKLFPISKNVKWIENWTIAYYNANTAVEEALLFLNTSSPWAETGSINPSNQPKWFNLQITASGKILPPAWEWNSDFDKDWNRLAQWEPIQLVFDKDVDWSQVKFYFKVPDIWWTAISLSWWVDYPIINWALSWSWKTFFASWSQIMATSSEIASSTGSSSVVDLSTRAWIDLNWSWWTFIQFYKSSLPFTNITWLWSDGADCSGYKCTLKLSIINPLISSVDNETIPYLEYRIDMWTNTNLLPLQYAIIKTDGFSYGFKKSIRKEVRQTTINEALDFTVFQ